MEVNDLEVMIDNLLNVEKEKETNRLCWDDKAKRIIFNCFNEVVNRWHIGWQIGEDNNPNLNVVYLRFITKRSEFTRIDADIIKNGGVLNFAQTFNGEISIKIEYPTIETVKPNKNFKIIETISPFDITKEVVLKYVSEFLMEMARWESENE